MGGSPGVNGQPQLLLPARRVWRRGLPFPCRVLVGPGAQVRPETSVVEGSLDAAPMVVEIGQAELLVDVGRSVAAGAVIARRKKLLGRGEEILSPMAGTVLQHAGAVIIMQPPPQDVRLQAQLPGSIAAVRSASGIDLEGHFGLLYAYGGAGAEAYGVLGEDLAVVAEPLTAERLNALHAQGVHAVVAPSWSAAEAPPVQPGLSYLLTEPVHGLSMAAPVAQALQQHRGQPAAIQFGHRPALAYLGLDGEQPPPQVWGSGSWVRASDGRTGRLLSIADRPRFFPSGLRAKAAEVDFGDATESLAVDSLEWVA